MAASPPDGEVGIVERPNLEEMSLDQKAGFVNNVRKGNLRRIALLEQQGFSINNVAGTRHEMFISYLHSIGILTDDQMADFDAIWEVELSKTIDGMEEQIRQAIEEHKAEQARPKLIGLNGKPIQSPKKDGG